ncbi:MAG: Crp/Fnr family transcriptional regulator, partial [Polaromonas sp.]|nr:Crp/Fnr family transcriptional regulator [Polaromonas sp.]
MSMLSNIELLLRVPLFSSLSSEEADVVASAVTKQRFRRAEIIVEQGRKSDALFIVLSGRARVLTTDSRGREVILATLQVGDYVGEMSLIDNEPHSATVQTETPTDCLVLGRAEFDHCLEGNTPMARAVMTGLVKRLRRADQKIESLALMDVYGRVAHVLLDAATPDADGNMVIRDKISRQDVAKMVGASREMVSRVMKDLEERGYIEGNENGSTYI